MLALAGLICLAPLTVYLLWLCAVTRRPRPTVVSGRWDFIALFLGLFGIIVYGGGLFLSFVHSNALFAIRGNWELLKSTLAQERTAWAWAAGGYALAILGLVATEMVLRRRSLTLYNMPLPLLEQTLEELFQQLGQPLERKGDTWWSHARPLFRLDAFDAGRTVTLSWQGEDDKPLFQEVERHLRQRLPSLPVPENPAVTWLTSGAIVGVVLTVVSFAILILLSR